MIFFFSFYRNEYEYEYNAVSSNQEEEEEEEEERYGSGIYGTSFLDKEAETRMSRWQSQLPDNEEILLTDLEEPWITMESIDLDDQITTNSSVYESPQAALQLDEQYLQENDHDDQMPEELTVSLKSL